jgi:hypothetical protein
MNEIIFFLLFCHIHQGSVLKISTNNNKENETEIEKRNRKNQNEN